MTDLQELTERIKPHCLAIKTAADQGDSTAFEVMSNYDSARSGVPHAAAICESYFEEWLAKQSGPVSASQ